MPDSAAAPAAYPPPGRLTVRSLDLEGQGVAQREDGKVVFIDGALPFEVVSAHINRIKNSFDKGTLTQRALEDQLWHIGKVRPDNMLRPIEGPAWAYRYRARLSVRYVRKKGEVLIGFHERKSHFVADMKVCPVLPAHVSAMLLPLRALIGAMDAVESLPQIELAIGDRSGDLGGAPARAGQGDVTALVLRHLQPLSAADKERLRAFAQAHPGVQWWLQPKGPDTIALLDPEREADTGVLAYSLSDYGITMPFRPTDFTQVNPHINRVLVARALGLLQVQGHERVIDWFCGLGNFTLPLATQARAVLGIEGAQS
ncbi:MAG: 23S rRNA (uracil(1939)-C(5))-methyltransferase, partial [Betaproteobacteria bacterium]|nr:23S rRNA (uracil(1939)-C(5))-methyltransferase [Betaproteobacteria bacterium]